MTTLLVLEKIVFSRKSLCVTLAGSDWAPIDFRAVYFTSMAVQAPFVTKSRVSASRNRTDIRFAVLVLVLPVKCEWAYVNGDSEQPYLRADSVKNSRPSEQSGT